MLFNNSIFLNTYTVWDERQFWPHFIIIIIIIPCKFFIPALADSFLLEFECQHDSSGLLGYSPSDLNNAVVWMVLACPPIFNSSTFFFNFLFLLQRSGTCISFDILVFSPNGRAGRQSPLFSRFFYLFIYLFLFVNHDKFLSSGRD